MLAEEGTDWFQGFFTFLYDVMSPFETVEDEETEATAEDVAGTSQTEGVQGQKTCVILGLQNQQFSTAIATKAFYQKWTCSLDVLSFVAKT